MIPVRGVLLLGIAAYCLYQQGFENGRKFGRMEYRIYSLDRDDKQDGAES